MKKIKHLVIEGNIGSGKTTAAEALSSYLNADLLLETFDDNPYLEKFYKKEEINPLRMETHFLMERYFQLSEHFSKTKAVTVSDYHFKKCLVFSSVNLCKRDKKVFSHLWKTLNESLRQPDLTVYLAMEPAKLNQNIKSRGREIEKELKTSYLEEVARRYEKQILQDPLIKQITLDGSAFLGLSAKELAEALIRSLEEKGHVLKSN